MLKEAVRQAVQARPEYAAIAPVVEKEILHHDIMHVLVQQGALQRLGFIGGTSLMWWCPPRGCWFRCSR